MAMTETNDHNRHPIDDFLSRIPDHDGIQEAHRERTLNILEDLANYLLDNSNTPPPLTLADDLSDGLLIYLFAHRGDDALLQRIPNYLHRFAEKARKHVERDGEFCLDHALGISPPSFKGAAPKKPGDHKHQRLFLMAFHDFEVAELFPTQIEALRNAAQQVALQGYEEKNLDGEWRKWRNANIEWLTWVFDLV